MAAILLGDDSAAPVLRKSQHTVQKQIIILSLSLCLLCLAMASLAVSGRSFVRRHFGWAPSREFVLVSLVLWYSMSEWWAEHSLGISALSIRVLWVADDTQGSSYGLCLNKYNEQKYNIEFVHVWCLWKQTVTIYIFLDYFFNLGKCCKINNGTIFILGTKGVLINIFVGLRGYYFFSVFVRLFYFCSPHLVFLF